jgi:hypothetical protein
MLTFPVEELLGSHFAAPKAILLANSSGGGRLSH